MNSDFMTGAWGIIKEIIGYAQICTFIDEWEEGVLLRRGKFSRVVKPGIAWHLPLGIDDITVLNVKPTALELQEQSLTTWDNKIVVIRGVIMWAVFDIRKALIDVEDCEATLGDIAVGVIQELVECAKLDHIKTRAFRRELKIAMQKQARKWGISVTKVKFQDLVLAPSLRIFGGLCE